MFSIPKRKVLRIHEITLSTDIRQCRAKPCIPELMSYPPNEDQPDGKHSTKLDKLDSKHYVPTRVLIMLPSLVLTYRTSCLGRFRKIGDNSFVSTFDASSNRFRS